MNTGEVDPTKLSEEGRKELLQYLRFREVQKILDELLRQRLIDPVMYDMVLRKYQRICSRHVV